MQEMRLPPEERLSEWVARVSAVITALNDEVIRLPGKKPKEVIRTPKVE